MSEFKKGDKLVFIGEVYRGEIFTFDNYYDIKSNPTEFIWVKELSSPFNSSYFRLATLLEIALQSE